jgi:AP-4 complex subunit sigma-1
VPLAISKSGESLGAALSTYVLVFRASCQFVFVVSRLERSLRPDPETRIHPSFRSPSQCSFVEYRNYKVIYRRYASLFFIVGTDNTGEENELGVLEFIHNLVETMDKYFENVCELDIMFNIEKAHFILDEMILNGQIIETNKTNILAPLRMLEKLAAD